MQITVGNTCLYNTLQGMVAPTTEQICCIVGNTPLYRHFQSKLPPTVNCRNVHELPGLPSHPKGLPSRQDNGTPNPLQTYLQGIFPAPLPKKCYGWHTRPPLEGLQGNSGVPSSWEGRGKGGKREGKSRKAQKKVAARPPFISFSRQFIGKNIPLTEIICSMQ